MIASAKKGLLQLPLWLRILIIFSLITGIFFRFYNLDQKLYSNDETYSTTYIYGRDVAEIIDRKIVSVAEIQTYQKYNTNESLLDSFSRIGSKPYVFPPLYAFLVQIWTRFWGMFIDNPAVLTRSLSAFISLFSLPLMYWLCREMFRSTEAAWIGTASLAVSPFQYQYSQYVRTYSLMTVAILLSSAVLLHVQRNPSRKNWPIYAVTIAFGLYSNVLFGFAIIAHGLYTLLDARFKITRAIRSYCLATIAGIAIFLPWFYFFVTRGTLDYVTPESTRSSQNVPFSQLFQSWLKGIPRIFIDFNDPWIEYTKLFSPLQKATLPLVLIFTLISIAFVAFNARKEKNWLILSLLFAGGGLLMLKDSFLGATNGGYSTRLRYILPYTLGIQLAVVAFLQFLWLSRKSWQKKVGAIALSALLILGILSCGIISQARSWWAFGAPDYPIIAEKLNELSKPVVLYDDFADALTMSYLVNDNVYFHLTRRPEFHLQKTADSPYRDYSNVILFRPPKTLTRQLQEKDGLQIKSLFDSKGPYPSKPNLVEVSR